MKAYRIRQAGGAFCKYFLLLLLMIIILLPFWQLVVSSMLKTSSIISYPPRFWPTGGSLDNFKEVLTMQGGVYGRWMINSIVVAGINTVMAVLFASMAGYAFATRKFPGSRILFTTIVSTQIIPLIATLVPLFLLISRLGWVNTYRALIFPGVANAFGVYMTTQFMKDFPKSLIEASTIDGCSDYGTFFKIVFPIMIPQISLLAIFNFTQQWGNLTWPLITINETRMKTLPLGIASMKDLTGTITGPIMAASLLSFIPILIAFVFASDKFIEGMTLGAIKG